MIPIGVMWFRWEDQPVLNIDGFDLLKLALRRIGYLEMLSIFAPGDTSDLITCRVLPSKISNVALPDLTASNSCHTSQFIGSISTEVMCAFKTRFFSSLTLDVISDAVGILNDQAFAKTSGIHPSQGSG